MKYLRVYTTFMVVSFLIFSAMVFAASPERRGGPPGDRGPRGPMSSLSSSHFTSSSSYTTSGCPREEINCRRSSEIEKFQYLYVRQNMEILYEESAQGQGSHIVALGQLMGCPVQDIPIFLNTVQQNYRTLLGPSSGQNPDRRSRRIIETMNQLINGDSILREQCQV